MACKPLHLPAALTHAAACMQGNCTRPANVEGLTGYRTPQCMLITDGPLLASAEDASILWLDAIFVRIMRHSPSRTRGSGNVGLVDFTSRQLDVYVTNWGFQGDGGFAYGLGVANGTRAHIAGALQRCRLQCTHQLQHLLEHSI